MKENSEAPAKALSPEALEQCARLLDVLMEVDFEIKRNERNNNDNK